MQSWGGERVRFGILIFPDAEELDFVGPWEMIRMWGKYAGGPEECFIVAEQAGPITCAKGMMVTPHVTTDVCPQLEFLLVPGGQGTRREVDNARLIEFISRQAKGCRAVLSVCTGAFLLHRAGLLSGRRATTHWASLDRLRALGDVTVVEERFVRDGFVWTAAGVSAGIDMTLAFIAEVAGAEAAGKVQLTAEYYPLPELYGGAEAHAQAPGYVARSG